MSRTRNLLVTVALGAASALALGLASPAIAHDRSRDLPTSYTLDGQLVFPEGIASDGRNLYVSAKSDGTIYSGSLTSTTLVPFLAAGQDGRTTATGLTVTRDRLIVAGAETGQAWVYDLRSGELVARFVVPSNTPGTTFVNDVVVAKDGTAYLTDSFRASIYKIDPAEIRGTRTDSDGVLEVAFDTSAASLTPGGFNANGIVTTPDGRGLLVVYSDAGIVYRVDLRTGAVVPVDLGGATVVNGDGLVRDGKTVYVVQNFDNLVTPIRLGDGGRRGVVGTGVTYDGADVPTTAVLVRGDLFVVNSQFDSFFGGAPLTSETFTVSRIDAPEIGR